MGLVKSERGSQGGYRLTKAPADYTAGEILRAIEGSVAPIPCLGSETNECPMSDQCFTLPFWAGLDEVINQYIDSVTSSSWPRACLPSRAAAAAAPSPDFSTPGLTPRPKKVYYLSITAGVLRSW